MKMRLYWMHQLSPIVSEFDNEEAAKDHEQSRKAMVAKSVAAACEREAHDYAMAHIRDIFDPPVARQRRLSIILREEVLSVLRSCK